ncbi:hypothetical protein ppKF707_2547 [Metapseudomonas furukawaii]|nr:hypothetical protein ppKF707_2547 [Pseudomonas furukawaii]
MRTARRVRRAAAGCQRHQRRCSPPFPTASSLATAILIATGSPFGVAAYGAAALALVALCSYRLEETAHLDMKEIDAESRNPVAAGTIQAA